MADDVLSATGVLAAIGVALIAARGYLGADEAEATTASTVMAGQVGQQVSMSRMHVQSVPADEGFWVDGEGGRMWVQIATTRESPYTVSQGDYVSFRGEVVAHNSDFPARVGVTSSEGATDLAAQRAHITIPVNSLSFDR